MPTERAIRAYLQRFHATLAKGQVHLTEKAFDEIEELGLTPADAIEHLAVINAEDWRECQHPLRSGTDDLWIFAPLSGETLLYVKIQDQRDGFYNVLSFHLWGDL